MVELFWCVLWVAGAVVGFQTGRRHFGMIGAAVGLILGFGGGLLISCGVACILNLAMRRRTRTTSKSSSE